MLLKNILAEVNTCSICEKYLPFGSQPLLQAYSDAKILIIGQAPGSIAHQSGIPWNDQSGKRLRNWMGIEKNLFYDNPRIGIISMGFCYPGRNNHGGDNPPRLECAPTWHKKILNNLNRLELTLLVGSYAQKYYLPGSRKNKMTENIRQWQDYPPSIMPIPHPSWRVDGWLKKNSWFEIELLPNLRARIQALLDLD